jgi:hypothetical protein
VTGEQTGDDAISKLLPLRPTIDTIISYLGPTSLNGYSPVYIEFYRLLIQHCRAFPKPPCFIILSTISASAPEDSFSLSAYLIVSLIKVAGADVYREVIARAAIWPEEAVRLKWTVFRVAHLNDGPMVAKGGRARYVGKGGWTISTSREDIGAWVAKEAEEMKGVDKIPAIFGGAKVWTKAMCVRQEKDRGKE